MIPSISRVHGGPSIALETMVRGLAQAGVTVHVATTNDDGAGHLDVPHGEPVTRDGATYFFFPRQTQFYKFSLPLTQWLRRSVNNYGVLHIHALFSYAGMPAAFFAKRADAPYILRPLGTLNRYGMQKHHAALKKISYPLIEQRMIANAAWMHYTSAQEKLEAEALGVTHPSVVIPLGVEIPPVTLKQKNGSIHFLYLARLDPIKGLDLLLPAFVRVRAKYPSAQLVLAGDGDAKYVELLKRQAIELGIGNAVTWTGFVTGEAKRDLLAQADVFVLPSYSENFGLAVVEAMAAGLPVIVTPGVAVAREIEQGGAGLVASPNAESLASAMLTLVVQATRRSAMGECGRRLVAEKYSVEAMTRALLALYQTTAHAI